MTKNEFKTLSRRHRWARRAAHQAADGGHDESAEILRGSAEFYARRWPLNVLLIESDPVQPIGRRAHDYASIPF